METFQPLWVIVKSGKKNWSGKEFSNLPAKVYANFEDAVSALNSYHFYTYDTVKNEYVPAQKKQKIEIIHLSQKQLSRLLAEGKARR